MSSYAVTDPASGEMWGLRFRFAAPPSAVATFRRSGRTLRAKGRGRVAIIGPEGCRLRWQLPFERRLPRGCARDD